MAGTVFLDRDGVIIEQLWYVKRNEFGPPHCPEDIKFFPFVFESLGRLMHAKYDLFLVSNQPDCAKGRATIDALKNVHKKLDEILKANNINFKEYFYCYHHPKGIVPEYSHVCECRKPKPFFLQKAAEQYGIDLKNAWMVGDQDTDVECGRAVGSRTILLDTPSSARNRGKSLPSYKAKDLSEAVNIIICSEQENSGG